MWNGGGILTAMSITKPEKIRTNDRSMSDVPVDERQSFFFPKHNPPVSVRAATFEEAQEILIAQDQERLQVSNQKEA